MWHIILYSCTNSNRYGLFGDTVNTASRMESNSKPGMVNCSSDSAKLLRLQAPHIKLIQRGEIEVKGKGMMTTYFVRGGTGLGSGDGVGSGSGVERVLDRVNSEKTQYEVQVWV